MKFALFDEKHLMKCRLAIFTKLEFLSEQKFHIFLSFCPTILVEEFKKCSYFLNRCLYLNKICVEMITYEKKNYAAYQYFMCKHGVNSDPCQKKAKN